MSINFARSTLLSIQIVAYIIMYATFTHLWLRSPDNADSLYPLLTFDSNNKFVTYFYLRKIDK